jgi:hypothetical protein
LKDGIDLAEKIHPVMNPKPEAGSNPWLSNKKGCPLTDSLFVLRHSKINKPKTDQLRTKRSILEQGKINTGRSPWNENRNCSLCQGLWLHKSTVDFRIVGKKKLGIRRNVAP